MEEGIVREDSIKIRESDLEAFDKIEPAFVDLFKQIQKNVNISIMESLKLVKSEFGGKMMSTFMPKLVGNVEKTLQQVEDNLKICFDEQYEFMKQDLSLKIDELRQLNTRILENYISIQARNRQLSEAL